jgi:uncharacterized protein
MSDILDTIKEDIKTAMKARDTETLSTLRMVHSSIKNQAIDLRRDLTDEEVIKVLAKEAKKRRQSADAFAKGDRQEMAEKELAEIEVIQKYLPPQLSDEEVEAIVEEVIEATGAQSRAEMGKVMGQVIPRVKGRYDTSKVKDIVLERL